MEEMNTGYVVRALGQGAACVAQRDNGRELGSVELIDYPAEKNGHIVLTAMWEARRPHERLITNAYGFPCFATRRAAAAHLAAEAGIGEGV